MCRTNDLSLVLFFISFFLCFLLFFCNFFLFLFYFFSRFLISTIRLDPERTSLGTPFCYSLFFFFLSLLVGSGKFDYHKIRKILDEYKFFIFYVVTPHYFFFSSFFLFIIFPTTSSFSRYINIHTNTHTHIYIYLDIYMLYLPFFPSIFLRLSGHVLQYERIFTTLRIDSVCNSGLRKSKTAGLFRKRKNKQKEKKKKKNKEKDCFKSFV